ncbi:MAG: LuxR C-terminal-related transcriptional regulator [Candidatus Velthaea sp.]
MIGAKTFRIVVIAAQLLYAKALCHVLLQDPDFENVTDLATIDVDALRALAPDLVLLDFDDSQSDFADGVALIKAEMPDVRVCVISGRRQPKIMQRCLDDGADGYVVKDVAPSDLAAALKIVADGAPYVDARVAGGLLRGRIAESGRQKLDELSPREADIVKLIAQGLANKDISVRLNLSDKTVKNHISRIFAKLHITARTQAAVYAIRTGLV